MLTIGGEPVREQDVDEFEAAILDIENAFVLEQRRRLILINITLPLICGRLQAPDRRADALKAAAAWYASQFGDAKATSANTALPSEDQVVFADSTRGNWDLIGLDVWVHARKLEVGETSKVVEMPGRFAVIRVTERDGNVKRAFELFEVELQTFPYVDSVEKLHDDYLTTPLEIVDPAWREIVPGFLKYPRKQEP